MNFLQKTAEYLIWVLISFVCAYLYVTVVIGPKPKTVEGFLDFLNLFIYRVVILEIVPILGSTIVLVYILLDYFYLKQKLKNNIKGISLRLMLLLHITLVVGAIHYLLEKVIDSI